MVALPRQGYSKSLGDSVECRSTHTRIIYRLNNSHISRCITVGSFFHNKLSTPIAKIGWHPWGENGSTLIVLTVDGVVR